MKPLLFLDTETTGIEGGRLIELGYAFEGDATVTALRVKNPVPIEIEAMATHHITEDHLVGLPFLKDMLSVLDTLKDIVSKDIVVAHNAKFDIGVLAYENIQVNEFIDTKRVAKHLLPEAPRHNLQYLRYYLKLDVGDSIAHSAAGDVQVLKALFAHLKNLVLEKHPDKDPIYMMQVLTRNPALVLSLQFGKHYGKTFEEVARTDPGYLRYLKNNPRDDEDVIYTVNYWLSKN